MILTNNHMVRLFEIYCWEDHLGLDFLSLIDEDKELFELDLIKWYKIDHGTFEFNMMPTDFGIKVVESLTPKAQLMLHTHLRYGMSQSKYLNIFLRSLSIGDLVNYLVSEDSITRKIAKDVYDEKNKE
jgi:hypothetical protein